MAINPVHFAHSICDEFLRYIFSAFPLSDPDLAKQARKLLRASNRTRRTRHSHRF
jgi:hypothetical protein